MNTRQFLISGWTWNGGAMLLGAAALFCYVGAFGVQRRIGYFVLALGVFLLALMSPLSALADGYLFSAHMVQHILLLLIVPALALMSLPRSMSLARWPSALAHPLTGLISGVGAMWVWHTPTLCNAAASSRPIYALQTLSLLALGGVFWRQVLAPRDGERLSPPAAVLYLFSACVACSVLGIILTFSPVTVCSVYATHAGDPLGILQTIRTDWGFTVEKDQQVGGLLMWVPMCLIYLGAIFAQVARWFAEPAPACALAKEA